ncbi:MAG: RsmB/NOP family class I SAM-dependent RNA methyltransferase [Oscillospiraceae bacterium]
MQYFEKRERELLGKEYDVLYSANNEVFRGITVNTSRISKTDVAKQISCLKPSPFCKNAFIIDDASFKIGQHPYHHAGAFYAQEPSAASPAELLGVCEGDFVLDACAAPGGKSAQLSAALNGSGLLFCNEFVPSRASVLKSNIERIGAQNTVILNTDVKNIAATLPMFFNKILVDAPCSGEGMFRKEPVAIRQHSENLVSSCAALGHEILDNAASCLAAGGTMIYSTCTFSSQENEMQIGRFLAEHSDFYIEPIIAEFGSEGEKARCTQYDYNAQYARRIYPCHGGEGHFMAKLRRKGVNAEKDTSMIKPTKPSNMPKCFMDFISQYFPSLSSNITLQISNTIYIMPKEPLPQISKLHVICAGVPAGNIVKDRFEPSHSLFMAYGVFCKNREMLTLDDKRTAAWLRGEQIAAETSQNGYTAVLIDGMPLGFGKVSSGVIKNHYPKGLRNLK